MSCPLSGKQTWTDFARFSWRAQQSFDDYLLSKSFYLSIWCSKMPNISVSNTFFFGYRNQPSAKIQYIWLSWQLVLVIKLLKIKVWQGKIKVWQKQRLFHPLKARRLRLYQLLQKNKLPPNSECLFPKRKSMGFSYPLPWEEGTYEDLLLHTNLWLHNFVSSIHIIWLWN